MKARHIYYDVDQRPWSVEGYWHHPQHRPYHRDWSGDYVILQEYGNFKNPIQLVLREEFDSKFKLAWVPLKVCEFCGFSRMKPCVERQTCPNLTDHHR